MSNNLVTVIIPTRNRPADLYTAVMSILNQERLPDELIIVDQSSNEDSRAGILPLFSEDVGVELIYMLDDSIPGLVAAKHFGAKIAVGDIICYLEDDVILESDYLMQIELGFTQHSDMVGCSGLITNPPRQTLAYELLFNFFHRGIFEDKRVSLYGRFIGTGHNLVACNMLSGGLSAWRRSVFQFVKFDVANGFHMFEDIDFSTRVARYFGDCLYINPNARLEHNFSPINREILGVRQRRKLTECILYYKKREHWPGAKFALPWLLIGMFLEALFQVFSTRSLSPVFGYFTGIRDGILKRVVLP